MAWYRAVFATLQTFVVVIMAGGIAALPKGPATAQDKKDSPPEAVAMYADAASFQNNGAFELAVDEWVKFLNKYPKDPLALKAQHYNGVCNLQLKKFDKAAEAFEKVLKSDPNFEFAEDAAS